ncbi:MAG: secretion system protein E [Pseudohongiella sp.]|nr:secretion system protein E [Pseudohongiella sp.]
MTMNAAVELQTSTSESQRMRLGSYFLVAGLISPDQLEMALQKQKISDERLGELLLRLGLVSEFDLARMLARQADIPFRDIDELDSPAPAVLRRFNQQFCLNKAFLPVAVETDVMLVAIGNADHHDVEQAVRSRTGMRCHIVQCEFSKLLQAIRQHYYFADHPVSDLLQLEIRRLSRDKEQVLLADKLIDHVLHLAVKQSTSDIHIQPEERSIHISFRIDGVLHPIVALPSSLRRLITTIKMQAGMDISDSLRPQDGSFSVSILETAYDIRVSSVVTEYGENLVLRLLPSGMQVKGLNQLGFYDTDLDLVNQLFASPHGILLMTGPTGSGKSTTLHAGLRGIGMQGKNIVTVEDPIEYKLPVIRQTEVNRKAGYQFDTAIRHFLRHDPDVMLVGEIRDAETAKAAITAAETGHLVLSTLHVNNFLGVVPRLQALGVGADMIANSLIGVINQRLARRICPACKEAYTPDDSERSIFGEQIVDQLYRGRGCDQCLDTGFSGRVAIYEVVRISETMAQHIAAGVRRAELAGLLRQEGAISMVRVGLRRVIEGDTTLDELRRLLGSTLLRDAA